MATKNIKYLNRQFNTLRADLISFAKTYFPTTYNDFGPASPGMMFIQTAAYVGDVLSYYLDNNVKQLFLQYAQNQDSVIRVAQSYGYKPPITTAASVMLRITLSIPSSGSVADPKLIPIILPNTTVASTTDSTVKFIIPQTVTFYTDSDDSVIQYPGFGGYTTLQKYVPAISAQWQTVNIDTPQDLIQY